LLTFHYLFNDKEFSLLLSKYYFLKTTPECVTVNKLHKTISDGQNCHIPEKKAKVDSLIKRDKFIKNPFVQALRKLS